MKLLFVGSEQSTGFLRETAERKGIEVFCTGEVLHIADTVNLVLERYYDVVLYEVNLFVDDSLVIAKEIIHTNNVNQSKVIIYAPGFHPEAALIRELLAAGIKNFILATGYGEMNEQFNKCLNGYYEVNAPEELASAVRMAEKEKDNRAAHQSQTIGVTGTQKRIGTTTQALQICKYLIKLGHSAAYISIDDDFIDGVYDFYEGCREDGIKTTYQGIDMYRQRDIAEVLKQPYDFFVYDYGAYDQPSFSTVSFIEKDYQLIVGGAKPAELPYMERMLELSHFLDAWILFSFIPDSDKNDLMEYMEERKEKVMFARYTPDPFEYSAKSDALYKLFLAVENKEKGKRKLFLPKKR